MSVSDTEIKVSAPGKIILHGEHAVVYGKAAIAATLGLRCHVTVTRTQDSKLSLNLPDIDIHKQFLLKDIQHELQDITHGSIANPIPATEEMTTVLYKLSGYDSEDKDVRCLAVVAFLYMFYCISKDSGEFSAVSVKMQSEIPVGAGLGSSAAFSVSVAAALLQLTGHIKSCKLESGVESWSAADKEVINKWAFIGEKAIHGRPSGIDNSISTLGGALKFQKGAITPIEKMPTLTVIMVSTEVPRSTMVLVSKFRQKYNTYPDIFDPVLDAVEAITEKSLNIFSSMCDNPGEASSYSTLGELMTMNHGLLNLMGVGHPALDDIISVAAKHGLQAKLTGAGGGGCAYILVPPGREDLEAVRSDLESRKYVVWPRTLVGGHGVLRHL